MIKTIETLDCFFGRTLNLIGHRIMLNHFLTFISLWIRLVTSVYVMSDVRGWIHVGFWILWWCIVLVLFISMLPTCGSTYRVEYTFLGTRQAKEQIAVEGPFKTVQLWFCKVFTSNIRTVLNQRILWAMFADRFKNRFNITSRASRSRKDSPSVSDVRGSIHVVFWILWWCNVLVLFMEQIAVECCSK